MLRRPLVVVLAIVVCGCCAGAVQALGIAPPGPFADDERDATAARAQPRGAPVSGGRVVVDTTADRPDADPGDGRCAGPRGRCTLRAAVMEANAGDELRSIVLRPRVYTLRVEGAGEDEARRGDLDVRRSVTIAGRGALIRGRGDRVLDVARGARLALFGARIAGGSAPEGEGGGAVRNRGRLTLTSVKLLRNVAKGDAAQGGAILNDAGALLLRASQVNRNVAGLGGGIASIDGTVLLRDTRVLANEATDGGGLALDRSASADVRDSEIDRNRARGHGGGARVVAQSTLAVLGTSLDANVAGGSGGAVHAIAGDVRLADATATGNRAGADGGALRAERGTLVVGHSHLLRNGADGDGGAVSSAGAQSALTGVQVNENRGRRGGAIDIAGGALRLDASVAQSNRAADAGGALAVGAGSLAEIDGGTYLVANQADGGGGGAIVNDGGRVTVASGPVSGNRAPAGSGGAILNRAGSMAISGGDISRNLAGSDGGGVALFGGEVRMADCLIDENTAARGGGLHLRAGAIATVGGDRGGRIARNRASAQGGGIWIAAGAALRLDRMNVISNAAPAGAARFDAG